MNAKPQLNWTASRETLTSVEDMLSTMKYMTVADEDLILSAENDPAAFWELFHRHSQPVYRYCAIHLGGNLVNALGVAARIFSMVVEKIAFSLTSKLQPFLKKKPALGRSGGRL